MNVETQLFGSITITDDKIINFSDGIIGFPDYKRFTLIIGGEKEQENEAAVFWLQSMDDGDFAIPVVDPFAVFEEYNPVIEDEWLKGLGGHNEEDLLVFLTMTVPEDITQMTVNQKAPLVINTDTQKACQIIVEDDTYQVRCPVYELLKSRNQEAGE